MPVVITYPAETVVSGGSLFNVALQSTLYGHYLTHGADSDTVVQNLPNELLLNVEDVKAIVNAGGEVEGYPLYAKMTREEYTTKLVGLDLEGEYMLCDEAFPFTYTPEASPAEVSSETGLSTQSETDSDDIYVLSSYNSEYLPASQFLGLFGEQHEIFSNKTLPKK